jgi:hypothetical protein
MSRIEASVLERIARGFGRKHPRGVRIVYAGVAVAAVAWMPLLLYIAFGPPEGNPIGLGLLAMLGTPVAVVAVLVGIVWVAVDRFAGRGR